MRPPSHKQLQRLAQAARLRVFSICWEVVARALGCRPDVCRRWPQKYPEEWRRFCAQAQQRRYEETNREMLATLQKLSRSDDPQRRQMGERLLAEWRRKFPEAAGKMDSAEKDGAPAG
jgi:hypothetical protein